MIFIDIETTYDKSLLDIYTGNIKASGAIKDPEKIKADLEKKASEAKEKMCVDKDFNEIRFVGILENGKYQKLSVKEFVNWVEKNNPSLFVSYNGIKFDFPVIIRNIIKQNINCSSIAWYALKEATERYSKNHIDLMDKLFNYGEWKSLDLLSQVYLGEKKEPIDFMTCSEEELTEHNEQDLRLLENLYNKFKFIF